MTNTQQDQAYGFVYLWFDRKRKKFCVGSHQGPKNDGYVTSTGHMPRAYKKRSADFKRRILWEGCVDRRALYAHEQRFLDMIKDEELGTKYYNTKKLAIGRDGPPWNKGLKGAQVAWNKGLHPGIVTPGFSNHKHTAASKAKIAENGSRYVEALNKIAVICPHCPKSGQYANMKRWHFDNCKSA